MAASCDVLILAAFPPELEPLSRALGDEMRGEVRRTTATGRATGVGLAMAAVGATMHLGVENPRAVLAIGTCGAYATSGLELGEVVVARKVRLVDPSSLFGLSEFPEPMSVTIDAHAAMADSIVRATRARAADVATTLAITVDDATAARIADSTGAHVEHLELYGIAAACAAKGIPFGALLAVANVVGANAREQWREHHHHAARAAADVAVRWLEEENFESDFARSDKR